MESCSVQLPQDLYKVPALRGFTLGGWYRSRSVSAGYAYRRFDPRTLGELEAAGWEAYYRQRWLRFGSLGLRCARQIFGLSWAEALWCSALVTWANWRWAPLDRHDEIGAQRAMARVYRVVGARSGTGLDPERAAQLDIGWWQVHRALQYGWREDTDSLPAAIAAFWSEVYGVATDRLAPAAELRAQAMRTSDGWVADGCPLASADLSEIRDRLVDSYRSLRLAVDDA